MRHSAGIALVLAAGLAACASDEAAEAFTLTDSSGVSIAVSREPLWPEGGGWQLGGQPTVVIGGGITDTSAIIGPIAGAMRLPDGRILVADEGATRLRWFADDGTILQSVGRKGEGPGEMQRIDALLHVGDSIAVVDLRLRRLSLFDLDGRFGRAITLTSPPESPFPPRPIGRTASGKWLGSLGSWHTAGEPGGVARDSIWVWLVGANGGPERLVGSLAGDDVVIASSPEFFSTFRPPYGKNASVRFHDGNLWVGTGDAFRVDQLDLNGRVARSIRWEHPPRPLSSTETDPIIDSLRSAFLDADDFPTEFGRTLAEALDSWKVPPAAPPYGTILFDDDGNLWVSDYSLEGGTEPVAWHVFDLEGQLLGDVVFPPTVDPTHILANEIIGIWTDPDGAEHVVAYPLIRDTPQS